MAVIWVLSATLNLLPTIALLGSPMERPPPGPGTKVALSRTNPSPCAELTPRTPSIAATTVSEQTNYLNPLIFGHFRCSLSGALLTANNRAISDNMLKMLRTNISPLS